MTARVALIVAAALLLTRAWFVTHRALDLDEFEHAHAAWSVSRGLVPYRDFFEHHSPGIYFFSAPLFADAKAATDPAAAIGALTRARAVMWMMTILSAAIVHRLGVRAHGQLAGALAAALLATSSQFLESMLEFRPDVPAVLCLLVSIWCLTGDDEERGSAHSQVLHVAAGMAFGGALLFTQKVVFAAPGLGLALLARRRIAPLALFAAGAVAPIAITMSWFAAHDALRAFWYYAVILNGRLNAERLSPFPRLLSNVVQQPAIYGLGVIALTLRLRADVTGSVRRTVIPFTALSLVAGIFVIGKAYDQYYVLLLPLLAVLAGALAADLHRAANVRAAVPVALTVGLAALSLAISARAFTSIAPQLDDIAFVTTQTMPADAYVGGSPGAALFRPHAWFYFFLTGDFAAAADYADLLRRLDSGALRPALIVRDRYLERHAPPPLVAYIDAHYRRARGTLYLRQSEYGSAALKTSDASDKFDRPLTR